MSRQFRSTDTDKWKYGFGFGGAGDGVISSNSAFAGANAGVATVAAGNTAITLDAASTFANGDLVLIHQTKGAGAGTWELNRIASGGGTTSIVLKHPTQNNYTDSGANPGASQCQIIQMTQYKNFTLNSGITWSAPAWDGNKGGIIAIFVQKLATINGAISTLGKGFRAATEYKNSNGPTATDQGEGSGTAVFGAESGSANGTGAGGGWNAIGDGGGNGSGGGSGGSRTAGSSGYNVGYSTAAGGDALWDTNGSIVSLGGGAGGRISGGAGDAGNAGTDGSGLVFIFAKNFVISSTGSINLNSADGNTGGDASTYSSGAGGAGSAIIGAETIDINTLKITAIGGAAKGTSKKGGNGGIVCLYSKSFTGTSNPTTDSVLDKTVRTPSKGGAFIHNFL